MNLLKANLQSRLHRASRAMLLSSSTHASTKLAGGIGHLGPTGNVVVPGETVEAKIARAKGYPYRRPSTSYLFVHGEVYTFPNSNWRGCREMADMEVTCTNTGTTMSAVEAAVKHGVSQLQSFEHETWTPILAIGSNASPEQLLRKFPKGMFKNTLIPVIQCVLEDFDVAYAPCLASYGSCPATLEYCPGTHVSCFVTYLLPPLAQRMHETEGAYNLLRLESVRLHTAVSLEALAAGGSAHEIQSRVLQYNHAQGTLHLPLKPSPASDAGACISRSAIAIAEVEAAGRQLPALTQTQMLFALMRGLDQTGAELPPSKGGHRQPALQAVCLEQAAKEAQVDETELDPWILRCTSDDNLRRTYVKSMETAIQPFSYPDYEVALSISKYT